MVNKAIVIGNLGADPQVGETIGGVRYCRLSVATNKRWTDKRTGEKRETSQWHRIMVWGDEIGTLCAQKLKKGAKVYVEGELQTRKWTDDKAIERYTTEIVVQGFGGRVVFCDASGGVGVPGPEVPPEDWRDDAPAPAYA